MGNSVNSKPKNIIVKMPNWIGDAVMATPILKDLKDYYSDAKLTAMCQANVASLLECNPYINEILSYSKPSGWMHRAWHKDIISPLQRGDYDLGVLLTNSLSSAYWFWKGKVKNIVGYSKGVRRFLLNQALPFPKEIDKQHLILTYKNLLTVLGIPISSTQPQLYLNESEKAFAKNFLKRRGIEKNNIVVGINPGAAYGSAKCWLPERFREVALKLLERQNVFILFFGDQNGASLVEKICRDLPDRVLNIAGKTNLRELMALINACSLFLTNDSGPMHIASAFQVPLLSLFGSTDEIKTGPYHHEKVIHKHVPCSPCFLRKCPKKDFPCMESIEVEEVYRELMVILNKVYKA
ncbi:Uncharacterized protein PHSC3_001277 [Chlamydiales bacterium STE3]|nr:Uncharacterized protein PHSC3_001277 [Chlamydiales bacterium STE3]